MKMSQILDIYYLVPTQHLKYLSDLLNFDKHFIYATNFFLDSRNIFYAVIYSGYISKLNYF